MIARINGQKRCGACASVGLGAAIAMASPFAIGTDAREVAGSTPDFTKSPNSGPGTGKRPTAGPRVADRPVEPMIGPMTDSLLSEMARTTEELARAAADVTRALPGRVPSARKADNSVVTETDHRIQAEIVRAARARFPDHAIVAEESLPADASRPAPPDAEYCWVIDPVDGTRNFVAGLPCFATSIAVLRRGEPVVGVVFEHNSRQTYAAIAGGGTKLNGEAAGVCAPDPAHDILLGIPSSKEASARRVTARWVATRGYVVRNLGSTALHLALVASGALAGMFCTKCKIWDIAAGVLLVREAGGRVTDLKGNDLRWFDLTIEPGTNTPVLAAEPAIHERLLETVRESASA